jgi:hypothetical protein
LELNGDRRVIGVTAWVLVPRDRHIALDGVLDGAEDVALEDLNGDRGGHLKEEAAAEDADLIDLITRQELALMVHRLIPAHDLVAVSDHKAIEADGEVVLEAVAAM